MAQAVIVGMTINLEVIVGALAAGKALALVAIIRMVPVGTGVSISGNGAPIGVHATSTINKRAEDIILTRFSQ